MIWSWLEWEISSSISWLGRPGSWMTILKLEGQRRLYNLKVLRKINKSFHSNFSQPRKQLAKSQIWNKFSKSKKQKEIYFAISSVRCNDDKKGINLAYRMDWMWEGNRGKRGPGYYPDLFSSLFIKVHLRWDPNN